MRKLLILMFVFGLVSSANAVIITFNSPSGPGCPHGNPAPSIDVAPGAIVLVQITADVAVTSQYMVSVTESTTSAAGHSVAIGPAAYNAAFNFAVNTGNVRNAMTNNPVTATQRYMLIDRATAGISPVGNIAAGQVLYQFEVAIPAGAVFCDTWTIDAAVGQPFISPPPAAYSHMLDAGPIASTNALTIHVVPEPMTIALLGLGGLFLRRRK